MTTQTKPPQTEREAVRAILEHGRRDPVWFIECMLGAHLWPTQRDIVRSVFTHGRTAVKACHSSGKTFVAAYVTLAFFYLYQDAKVLTTAPTWVQVEKLLWGELRAAFERIPHPLGGELLTTELRAGPNWWAMGLSTDQGVKFQGHHGDHILVVIDEAPGVKPEISEAIEGIRAGGSVRVLALGNPTIASGPFYDAFTSQRDSWATFTISAFDTPNLDGLTLDGLLALDDDEATRSPYPYLTTREWVREKYREWGPGHPLWEARVLGNFPAQAEDALISLTWLEQARYREHTPSDAPIIAGLDVAAGGEDETVLCIRQGDAILELRHWAQQDPRGEVVAALSVYKSRMEAFNVDSVGVGHGIALHMQDQGFPVQRVNVGEASDDKEKYANLKAELYWGLRMRFAEGSVSGLTDETALAQLTGIRYSHNPRGQVVIESKEQARKRGVKSPDRAEAIMLAFAKRDVPGAPAAGAASPLVSQYRQMANRLMPRGGGFR